MANILEFLRGLLTSGDEQQRFEGNPHGYLRAHGFDDLSGEDVAEAIRALTRTLPGDVADRLAPFQSEDGDLPSVRPQIGETELDAAVRQLQFATSLSPAESAGSPPEPEPAPEPVAEREPEPVAEPEPVPVPVPVPEPVPEPEPEPVASEPEPASEPVYATQGAIDPYRAFGEELSSIIRHAGDQMQEVLRRAEDQVDAIVRQAEREADAIREQADAILRAARDTQQEAQRQAMNLVKNAEHESSAMLADARSRRDETGHAERERLQGVETVFRSLEEDGVVPDDPEG